ncbi:PRC-barrel domain-containing protein [Pelagicoccus sp. SDUM812003]|uniref:PRC-barrel domain-containing protein n=1 Tax=Pelagicoccus sp. SDUM812003 TaxID=3041267 RepID=UPI00280DDF36|nr:PRC-barrel domain-containing protein [Pelagicoccus sp. SDUM812003]MDQ8204436.1 PRC-barrel domain-containing protein [Pelagicoccus sp. SDUM812003]
MLRSLKDVIGYPLMATDGKAGKVKDVLFGDRHWRVRYLDVDTRSGFHLKLRRIWDDEADSGGTSRVLVPSERLGEPTMGLDRRQFPVNMSSEEISCCPHHEELQPVEEKYQSEFRRFFRRNLYQEQPFATPFTAMGSYLPMGFEYEPTEIEYLEHQKRMKEIAGEHLHSAKAIFGYQVQGQDEEALGTVSDLIMEVDRWVVAYAVVTLMHSFPHRKYLVKLSEVRDLDWASSSMKLDLTKDQVMEGRRYWAYDSVNCDEDGHEYDYFGRPRLGVLMEETY